MRILVVLALVFMMSGVCQAADVNSERALNNISEKVGNAYSSSTLSMRIHAVPQKAGATFFKQVVTNDAPNSLVLGTGLDLSDYHYVRLFFQTTGLTAFTWTPMFGTDRAYYVVESGGDTFTVDAKVGVSNDCEVVMANGEDDFNVQITDMVVADNTNISVTIDAQAIN